MEIKVKIKNVYGNETVYPECDKAKTFAKIAGQKTLTAATVAGIKQLGYAILVVSELTKL